jgi:hypothetical protein
MIKFHELKVGDIVLAEYDGQRSEGEVIGLDGEDKLINIQTSVQDFWFSPEQLFAIPLDDQQLEKLYFERQEQPDGSVKYLKGPFRILLSRKGDFSHFEMWYREDRRHIAQPINVHDLQNHYKSMTKVDLVREPMRVYEPGVQAH